MVVAVQTPRGSPLPGIATHMGVGSAPGWAEMQIIDAAGLFRTDTVSVVSRPRYLISLAPGRSHSSIQAVCKEANSRMRSGTMTRASPRRTQYESGFRGVPSQRFFPIWPRRGQYQGLSRSLRSILWVRNQGRWESTSRSLPLESGIPNLQDQILLRDAKIHKM